MLVVLIEEFDGAGVGGGGVGGEGKRGKKNG